jgi:hypothetical protein
MDMDGGTLKLTIDLEAQAFYVDTDGTDVYVDVMTDGYTTKSLDKVMDTDGLVGIEFLELSELVVIDEYGEKHQFYGKDK